MSKEGSNLCPTSKVKGFVQNSKSERLRKSLETVATLIDKGDEDLWPIFEKLEKELTRIELKQNRLLKYVTN